MRTSGTNEFGSPLAWLGDFERAPKWGVVAAAQWASCQGAVVATSWGYAPSDVRGGSLWFQRETIGRVRVTYRAQDADFSLVMDAGETIWVPASRAVTVECAVERDELGTEIDGKLEWGAFRAKIGAAIVPVDYGPLTARYSEVRAGWEGAGFKTYNIPAEAKGFWVWPGIAAGDSGQWFTDLGPAPEGTGLLRRGLIPSGYVELIGGERRLTVGFEGGSQNGVEVIWKVGP